MPRQFKFQPYVNKHLRPNQIHAQIKRKKNTEPRACKPRLYIYIHRIMTNTHTHRHVKIHNTLQLYKMFKVAMAICVELQKPAKRLLLLLLLLPFGSLMFLSHRLIIIAPLHPAEWLTLKIQPHDFAQDIYATNIKYAIYIQKMP